MSVFNMEVKKKILVLCGGEFAFKSLHTLGFEKYLCGIGIGNGAPFYVETLENESLKSGYAFKSFPTKKSINLLRDWLNEVQPDYIFSIAFPYLLPQEVLDYGTEKFINFHTGPLPRYRGAMPIFEVLRNQEKHTAICAHFMNQTFDQGNIIFNDSIQISKNETYGSLATKMSNRMGQVVLNVAHMLEYATKVPSTVQNEMEACYYEKPALRDTFIQWNTMNATEINALVNACNPWNTGADAILLGEQIKIIDTEIINEFHADVQEGTILSISEDNLIKISCADNQVIGVKILSTSEGIMNSEKYIKLKRLNSLLCTS